MGGHDDQRADAPHGPPHREGPGKSDPDCASWLHVIVMRKDPTVLQELEVALARRLGKDEDETPALTDDPFESPPKLRRTGAAP